MKQTEQDIARELRARSGLIASLDGETVQKMAAVAGAMVACLQRGRVIYTCGNGGSATQAAHFAAELVGRFKMDRGSLPAFSLGENSAVVTSLANDYSFDDVFSRQIEGLGQPGDCLLALSTSGTSRNMVRACRAAAEKGLRTFALTGEGGGEVIRHCEVTIAVPTADTPLVQELHLVILHILCRMVEAAMFPAR
jgi:phosphoheptose isomerase